MPLVAKRARSASRAAAAGGDLRRSRTNAGGAASKTTTSWPLTMRSAAAFSWPGQSPRRRWPLGAGARRRGLGADGKARSTARRDAAMRSSLEARWRSPGSRAAAERPRRGPRTAWPMIPASGMASPARRTRGAPVALAQHGQDMKAAHVHVHRTGRRCRPAAALPGCSGLPRASCWPSTLPSCRCKPGEAKPSAPAGRCLSCAPAHAGLDCGLFRQRLLPAPPAAPAP